MSNETKITALIEKDISELNHLPGIKNRIGKVIARGGWGVVCEWNDGKTEKKVVKIRDPEYARMKNGIILESGPEREFDITRWAAHTLNMHLMPMYEGSGGKELWGRKISWIVMPKMQTIEEIPAEQELEEQVGKIISDCCEGLHVLHTEPERLNIPNGIPSLVHGDLKPDNIFVYDKREEERIVRNYIIGDYSSSFEFKDNERCYGNYNGMNPYGAPGKIDQTSDIWSLGWIMWYWLSGKKHPAAEDVKKRKIGDISLKPEAMGPEIWEVFLKMTEIEPSKRYQSVDVVKDELDKALKQRRERIEKDNNFDSALTGAVLGAGAWAVISGIVKWSGSFGQKSNYDKNGNLHGKVNADVELKIGGIFRGEWEHGWPIKGTFICPNGQKRNGNWNYKADYLVKVAENVEGIFEGMTYIDKGKEIFCWGKVDVKWPSGTSLSCAVINGDLSEGTMEFADGRKKTGQWTDVDITDNSGMKLRGLYCREEVPVFGYGQVVFTDGAIYEGELWQGKPVKGNLNLPGDIAVNKECLLKTWSLLKGMQECGSHFRGGWDKKGVPLVGTYTFSDGSGFLVNFSYVEEYPVDGIGVYSGIMVDGKFHGYGRITGVDGDASGEFKDGLYHGNLKIEYKPEKAVFYGTWNHGSVVRGRLVYTDKREIASDSWSVGQHRLERTGYLFDGLYTYEKGSFYGVGYLQYFPTGYAYKGEIWNGTIMEGRFYDPNGRGVSREEVNKALSRR